jgi:uncharacterized membrane protein (Fun14 family)
MTTAEPQKARAPFPRWKKISIAAAGLLVLSGIGLRMAATERTHRDSPTARTDFPGDQSLVDDGFNPPAPIALPPSEAPSVGLPGQASPFLIEGGIGFLAGMAIGTVFRMFFKAALGLCGLVLVGVVLLSATGLIGPIDWKAVESWVSARAQEVDKGTAGLRANFLASLPSMGLTGVGLVAGWRRK